MTDKIKKEELLTTGEAAEILCVTPDAVRKWVQFGKLAAVRTPGGHYRIPRSVIEMIRAMKADLDTIEPEQSPFRFCWEFCGTKDGVLDPECESCLVYKTKTLYCFELNNQGVPGVHKDIHCKTDCTDCGFYTYLQAQIARK